MKDFLMGFAVSTGTALASALAGRYGLAGALTVLGALGMVLTFSGWLLTRPNTGSSRSARVASSGPHLLNPRLPSRGSLRLRNRSAGYVANVDRTLVGHARQTCPNHQCLQVT